MNQAIHRINRDPEEKGSTINVIYVTILLICVTASLLMRLLLLHNKPTMRGAPKRLILMKKENLPSIILIAIFLVIALSGLISSQCTSG
ncbi:MAG: hypothetical protein Q8M29_01475 [Bacteroidota bacterium]|nr:hypothetical protein [Bacteroidota bacterium]